MFADTHVHPIMKYVHQDRANLWKSFGRTFTLASMIGGEISGIPKFSQSDFRRLAKGNFQIVFCALHPPEQKIMFTPVGGVLGNVVDNVAGQVISIPDTKIKVYRKPEYDHFHLLNYEYHKLINGQNQSRNVRINGKQKKCSYKVVRTKAALNAVLNKNKNDSSQHTIAVIPSIEGLHSLGCGHVKFGGNLNPFNVDQVDFLNRLDHIKGNDTALGQGWAFPPIVANITHAFSNGLCGHAQAISKTMRNSLFEKAEEYSNPIRPSGGLNHRLSDFGAQVIKKMLNLDGSEGKRILPDIKHMSTATRKDYYAILDAHHAQHPGDIIPVIMSHAALNGKNSINEDNFNPRDREEDYKNANGYNPSSINLYKDEVIRIHETEGLAGIIFDERILAGKKKLFELKQHLYRDADEVPNNNRFKKYPKGKAWAKLITDQIHGIVTTVLNSNTTKNKMLVWDRICIGTDFDGQINPVDGYKKAMDFKQFKKDLLYFLEQPEFHALLQGTSPQKIADKICFDNVHTFLKKHL